MDEFYLLNKRNSVWNCMLLNYPWLKAERKAYQEVAYKYDILVKKYRVERTSLLETRSQAENTCHNVLDIINSIANTPKEISCMVGKIENVIPTHFFTMSITQDRLPELTLSSEILGVFLQMQTEKIVYGDFNPYETNEKISESLSDYANSKSEANEKMAMNYHETRFKLLSETGYVARLILKMQTIEEELSSQINKINDQLIKASHLQNGNYKSFNESDKNLLGSIWNNMLVLVQLISLEVVDNG